MVAQPAATATTIHALPYEVVALILSRALPSPLPQLAMATASESNELSKRLALYCRISNLFHLPALHLLYSKTLTIANHASLLLLIRTLDANRRQMDALLEKEPLQQENTVRLADRMRSLRVKSLEARSLDLLIKQVLQRCGNLKRVSIRCSRKREARGDVDWPARLFQQLCGMDLVEISWTGLGQPPSPLTQQLQRQTLSESDTSPEIRFDPMSLISGHCATLRHLSLQSEYLPTLSSISLTPIVSPLCSLSLVHCQIPYNFFSSISLPSLTTLTIHSLAGLSALDFHTALGIFGPQLTSLTLMGVCTDLFQRNPIRLSQISFKYLYNLRHIKLGSSAIPLDLFQIVSDEQLLRMELVLEGSWDADWLLENMVSLRLVPTRLVKLEVVEVFILNGIHREGDAADLEGEWAGAEAREYSGMTEWRDAQAKIVNAGKERGILVEIQLEE